MSKWFKWRRIKTLPRVLFILDKPNWAFDITAKEIKSRLKNEFEFDFEYVDAPESGCRRMQPNRYDLVYLFFWGEEWYRKFEIDPERVIKGVSSHRWEDDPVYGPCKTADVFVRRFLRDAAAVCCTSRRLFNLVAAFHPEVFHTPNGFNSSDFFDQRRRSAELKIGWAGNPGDPVKRFRTVLIPASDGFELKVAGGDLGPRAMNEFYNSIDVIAVTSKHEGEPLPLIEAMAAGCFPVCGDVGIVPELVQHGENGLVVRNGTPSEFREAFAWCAQNIVNVRRAGSRNAFQLRNRRSWEVTIGGYSAALHKVMKQAARPRFRNDDVSADTDLKCFAEFCRTFWDAGCFQTHGITLFGKTSTTNYSGRADDLEGTEYEGFDNISRLPNDLIRQLSEPFQFARREDLMSFISKSDDQIALHGLYHTDYSKMSPEEQHKEIVQGLELLHQLFPAKTAKYFIPPFNRTNDALRAVSADLGLTVLHSNGVHLEENLENVWFEPAVWYRYHHHRFYPQSPFRYHNLSMLGLRECLWRNFQSSGKLARLRCPSLALSQ